MMVDTPAKTPTYKFEPWVLYDEDQHPLPISEPPCNRCVHWHPVRQYAVRGEFSGVTLCHAPSMNTDFSCFFGRVIPEDKR